MTVLVLGPNGSGKSAYAEKLTAELSAGELVYIATMIPYGEEGLERVDKHKKQRGHMGFITVEKPNRVSEVSVSPDTTVLLEDVSNLLGNTLFGASCFGNEDSVFNDITRLCDSCRAAVMVSIDGLTQKPEYDSETNDYIKKLNQLNGRLSDFSDVVVTMRDGKPVHLKDVQNELNGKS